MHRLAYSFGWDGDAEVPPGSGLVEIDLIDRNGGTLLRFTHSGLPNAAECAGHEKGWAHYLDRLVVAAAGRDPGPDPGLRKGAAWKALISRYIAVIPPSGDVSGIAAQSMPDEPPPEVPVSSAMTAKVGDATRPSQSAAPGADAWPLPPPLPGVSHWVPIMVQSPVCSRRRAGWWS